METFRILLLSCLLLACTFYPKPTGKPNKNLCGRLNFILIFLDALEEDCVDFYGNIGDTFM